MRHVVAGRRCTSKSQLNASAFGLAMGDLSWANDSHHYGSPRDGPSVGLDSQRKRAFHGPLSEHSGRPKWSMSEGERRPLRPEVVPQHPVGVGPCGSVAPPRWSGPSRPRCIRRTTTTDHSRAGHRGDNVQFRRSPSPRTPRCPRFFAVSSTKSAAAARSPGRPSGRLTRGERRPYGRKRRPTPGRRLSPAGTSLPPRNTSRSESGYERCTVST